LIRTHSRVSVRALLLFFAFLAIALLSEARSRASQARPRAKLTEAKTSLELRRRMAERLPRSTVRRPSDLVVVNAEGLPLLGAWSEGEAQGPPLEHVRVMSFFPKHDWEVIPFQIDERDASGRWIAPGTREPALGAGILSTHDQIIFRARDLGVRAARPAWPEGVKKGIEVAVRDATGGGRGWSYVFVFDAPPPLPRFDEVRDVPAAGGEGEAVVTPYYRVRFAPVGGGAFMTELAIDGRGLGHLGPNLLDRMKSRTEGSHRLLPRAFRRSESNFSATPDLLIDGPLRVIRRTRVRVPIPFWPDATMDQSVQFLPDQIVMEGPDRLPRRVLHFAWNLRLRLSWDFTAPPGAKVHAAPVPSGVLVDGYTDPVETALDGAPSFWWALSLPKDGALVGVFENADLSGGAPTLPVIFYRDGPAPDPPESEAGSAPGVGWNFDHPGADDPAITPNRIHLFVLDTFRPGAETGPLDTATRPLQVLTGRGLRE